MEAVKTWRCSREELLGVEGAERSEGDGGNWGGPRWPGDCGVRRSAASYNRVTGKGTAGQQGVGGGRSTDRAGWTTQPPVMGRAAASSVRRLEGGPVSAVSASPAAGGSFPRAPVRALQHALYRAAKADPGRRFHALYDKVSRRDVLQRAWEQVRRNRGAPGIDQLTIQQVEQYGVDRLLDKLAVALEDGSYRPLAARRVLIPKPGSSEQRPLSIPTVTDRVAGGRAQDRARAGLRGGDVGLLVRVPTAARRS